MPDRYHVPLECGAYYHVFSRAVGDEKVFRDEENYHYFLDRLRHHVSPVAAVLAYSLMPNHFHLLIRIREEEEVMKYFLHIKKVRFNAEVHSLNKFVMERFSNWLNGYCKAINKRYRRRGGLFMDYLRRNKAEEYGALFNFLFYIHNNAVHHGLAQKIGLWPYDSYRSLLSSGGTWLDRDEVMTLFESKQTFARFHQKISAPDSLIDSR